MPFNARRRTVYKPAAQLQPGDHIGSLDSASEVHEVARDGDRVTLRTADGRRYELNVDETVSVISAD